MPIRVEFFGIARQRTGTPACEWNVESASTLRDLLRELACRYPQFADALLRNGELRPEFIANRNGDEFIRDSETLLRDNETILILSTDAGG